MKNKLPQRGQILNHKGEPFKLGYYDASKDSLNRKLFWGHRTTPSPESEMLPQGDRLKIISYLRRSIRNNSVIAALCRQYALTIGTPRMRALGSDPLYNDVKERLLEKLFKKIGYGNGWTLQKLLYVINIEELIAGECFVVFTEEGELQLIESELCGSPKEKPDSEVDGIKYNSAGNPVKYRFGSWVKRGGQSEISYEKEDSTFVNAEYVFHFGSPSRIQERRYSPKLSAAIPLIHDLQTITDAKVQSIKIQSAFSLAITKNGDASVYAQMMADNSTATISADQAFEMYNARTSYQDVQSGQVLYLENGESIQPISSNFQSQDFDAFQLTLLDRICAVIGIPPEEVIIGYRKSNYSSARADKLRWKMSIDYIREDKEIFLDRLQRWLVDLNSDKLPVRGEKEADDVLFNWPVVPSIDEQKEAQAKIALYQAGMRSMSQIANEDGLFSDQIQAEIIYEAGERVRMMKAKAEELGVSVADIAAQMPNGIGLAQFLSLQSEAVSPENN